jgi:hypothetical protein
MGEERGALRPDTRGPRRALHPSTRSFGIAGLILALLLGAMAAPSAGAEEAEELGTIGLVRMPNSFVFSACLPGIERTDFSTTVVAAESQILINGALAATSDTAVRWSSPHPGIEDDPAANSCPKSIFVTFGVMVEDLPTFGVLPPANGEWRSFEVELRVQLRGRTFVGTRSAELGAGRAIGAVTSIHVSSEGAHIRGWAADPGFTGGSALRVTVDGRHWPQRTPNPGDPVEPSTWEYVTQLWTNTVDPDPKWQRRGLSPMRGFDLTVPHGRVCVYAFEPDPSGSLELDRTSRLLGCLTSPITGRRSATLSATASQVLGLNPSSTTNVTVRGVGVDPWAGQNPAPREVVLRSLLSGQRGWAVVRPRPDLPTTMPDRSGSFDFVTTMPSVIPGRHTICAYLSKATTPLWWARWSTPPGGNGDELLGCTSVVVPGPPAPPRGNLERLTANGGVITVSGWALDPNGGSPRVLLTRNGVVAGLTQPNRARPDVARLLGGDGRAGFEAKISAPPGEHQVCATWQDTTDGTWVRSPVCANVVVK